MTGGKHHQSRAHTAGGRKWHIGRVGLAMLIAYSCSTSDRPNVSADATTLDVAVTPDKSAPNADSAMAVEIAAGGASCQHGVLSMNLTAPARGAVAAHTTIAYDIAVKNDDPTGCDPRTILVRPSDTPHGFAFFLNPPFNLAAPGQTVHFTASLTGTTDAAAGSYTMPFDVFDPATNDTASDALRYELAPLPACVVRPSRELFVTDLSVVEDPIRTSARTSDDARAGAWTFARLMENAAATPGDAPRLAESLFASWRTDQTINGLIVRARKAIDPWLLDRWPRQQNGELDLAKAPLRLLAIVNRMDMRSSANGHAGQGRFVFGVLALDGSPAPFTIIFEFRLPAASEKGAPQWAADWHALGGLPFPSEAYNAQLQRITDRFTAHGAEPRAVNGSALATVRTDEVALDTPWELRQFQLARADGLLHEAAVDRTPDATWLGSNALAAFINTNERAILADRETLPRTYQKAPFLAGSALNQLIPWDAPGIRSARARREFSAHTCNGCHAARETGTEFVHVSSREVGAVSSLSGFLLGIVMQDPVTHEPATFNEIGRRKTDLEHLVCAATNERGGRAGEGPTFDHE